MRRLPQRQAKPNAWTCVSPWVAVGCGRQGRRLHRRRDATEVVVASRYGRPRLRFHAAAITTRIFHIPPCFAAAPHYVKKRARENKGSTMGKTSPGNCFEDFRIGQVIRHATPRTVTVGDVALYTSLFGGRFAVQSSDEFAKAIGYPCAPIDDFLVFHIIFGKTVPDVSLNAVANLGYAGCYFRKPVYPGDTLTALSEVIGLKENSSRKTGIVYVRTTGYKQDGSPALEYVRWVMVRKGDEAAPAPGDHVPRLPTAVDPKVLGEACPPVDVIDYDFALAG